MGTKEEPPFDKLKTPSIVTIVMMAIMLVMHAIQYWAAGDWSATDYIVENVIIVFWGIVVPIIIIVLIYIGKKTYQDTESITLIFGIIFVVLSGITTAISSYWIVRNIVDLVINIPYGAVVIICYVIMIPLIIVVLVMQIKNLLASVEIIKAYQAKA
jgi:hypothetical protein